MREKLNALLAILTIIVVIVAMLAFCGIFKLNTILSYCFIGLGAMNIINSFFCYQKEEKKEFKIFLISGIFIILVAAFLMSGNLFKL